MQSSHRWQRRFVLAALITAIGGISTANAQDIVLDAADARDFFGDWAMTLETPDGKVSVAFNIGEVEGKAAVRFMGAEPITNLVRSDDTLIARYQMNYQGSPIPVVLTIDRAGENLRTMWDFAEGAYMTSGVATKPS